MMKNKYYKYYKIIVKAQECPQGSSKQKLICSMKICLRTCLFSSVKLVKHIMKGKANRHKVKPPKLCNNQLRTCTFNVRHLGARNFKCRVSSCKVLRSNQIVFFVYGNYGISCTVLAKFWCLYRTKISIYWAFPCFSSNHSTHNRSTYM